MTAFTEVLKLYLPGGGSLGIGGDDETADIDRLNQNFQKIDDFAAGWGIPAERNQQFYGLAAGLDILEGMKQGDTYQESDGDKRQWQFDGLNWVTGENGMYLLRPDTLAGATISESGTIVPTVGASIFDIDFKSLTRYREVRVTLQLENGGSVPQIRFRRGTTTLQAAASYMSQRTSSNGTTTQSSYDQADYIYMSSASQPFTVSDFRFFNLGTTGRKSWLGRAVGGQLNPQNFSCGGYNFNAEAQDPVTGFRINLTAGTVPAGTNSFIKVYGIV